MAVIQILVDSTFGTAQGVAKFIAKQWSDQHAVKVNVKPTIDHLALNEYELLLPFTSNSGTSNSDSLSTGSEPCRQAAALACMKDGQEAMV